LNLLVEAQYLPNISYFKMINKASKLTIEANENFQKQSFRNRTMILTANKVDILTVPVLNANSKLFIRDVQIDYSQNWINTHLRSIRSAYGNSPFFEHYYPHLEQLISKQHKFLFDLNYTLLEKLIKLLKISTDINISDDYYTKDNCPFDDIRDAIHPKKNIEMNLFTQKMIYTKYSQVFGEHFVENLSIIDLLMNEGSAAKQYL
jgi:hypothetical protein